MSGLLPSPFHARTAALNRRNAWTTRNDLTLALDFGDPTGEALAARFSAIATDISWRWRVRLDGTYAAQMLARLMTRDPATLRPGTAMKALWLNDAGALRGAGVVACEDEKTFVLASAAPDRDWIAAAARLFDVAVTDASSGEAGLALIGPYAARVLAAAGLDPDLAPLAARRDTWHGIAVTLTKWGEHGGYEVWCSGDDAHIVWDRILRAGEKFDLRAAGMTAADTLDLEAGVPRPGRDYLPAVDAAIAEPLPAEFGLESLIDPMHTGFNGRDAWLSSLESPPGRSFGGVLIESETPAPHTPLYREGRVVGRTLGSLFSPALRHAIALAQFDPGAAVPGMRLVVPLPTSIEQPSPRNAGARVADLPFLPVSDSVPA